MEMGNIGEHKRLKKGTQSPKSDRSLHLQFRTLHEGLLHRVPAIDIAPSNMETKPDVGDRGQV